MAITNIFNALSLIIGLLTVGKIAHRFTNIPDTIWAKIDKLVYFVLLPALIVSNLINPEITARDYWPLIFAIATTLTFLFFISLSIKKVIGFDFTVLASFVQGASRLNTFIGLGLVDALFTKEIFTQSIQIITVMIIQINILCVFCFVFHRPWNVVVRTLFLNPLIVACATGLFLSINQTTVPAPISTTLHLLGQCGLVLGLISVGAALKFRGFAENAKLICLSTVIKLIAAPGIAFVIGHIFDLAPITHSLVVLFFALPTAPSGYALARELGGDATFMAQLISIQTIVCFATLPLITFFLV